MTVVGIDVFGTRVEVDAGGVMIGGGGRSRLQFVCWWRLRCILACDVSVNAQLLSC